MLKLIGILVLSSHLSVAVETDKGFSEASFPNTVAGAEDLVGYAEETIGDAEDGIHVVVGWLDDDVDDEFIVSKLASLGIKHAIASSADIRTAVVENKLAEDSPTAVALAFKKRFGFMWTPNAK
jgi:hypothetical protein